MTLTGIFSRLCFSSPARLRRFFGVGHKNKKKKSVEGKDIEVVVVDVDPNEDSPQHPGFTDSGWYSLASLSSIAKVGEILFYFFVL